MTDIQTPVFADRRTLRAANGDKLGTAATTDLAFVLAEIINLGLPEFNRRKAAPVTATPVLDYSNEVVHMGMTRGTLEAAFKRVADPANWKNPIDHTFAKGEVTIADLNTITIAVAFYTGSETTITREAGKVHVTAPGYYRAIGP